MIHIITLSVTSLYGSPRPYLSRLERHNRMEPCNMTNIDIPSEILRWKWLWGIPRDFWLVNRPRIADFIRRHKVEPLPKEQIGAIDWVWLYGGRKTPHLHLNENTYLLSPKQWREFSTTMLKDFSEKLAAANTVNFEQFMDVADTVTGLP